MSKFPLIRSIRKRFSWAAVKEIFRYSDIPRRRGKDSTINGLEKSLRDYDEGSECDKENFSKKINSLKSLYKQHLIVGEKVVKAFSLSEEEVDLLKSLPNLCKEHAETSDNSKLFCFPSEELQEIDLSPELIFIEQDEECVYFIFSSRRYVTERLSIDPKQIKLVENSEISIDRYQEVIAIRQNINQFFDIVALRKSEKMLEFRLDNTLNISKEDLKRAYKEVQSSFLNLFRELTKTELNLSESINFFPLIRRLYDSTEGVVCELGFTTDEGSVKVGRMRQQYRDLRSETFHKAGKSAVGSITPFRLSIRWKLYLSDEPEPIILKQPHLFDNSCLCPELSLIGKYYDLKQVDPCLNTFFIEGCITTESYNFIFYKVIKYLNWKDEDESSD